MGVPASACGGSSTRPLAWLLAFPVRLLRTVPRTVRRKLALFPLLVLALLLIPTSASQQQPRTLYVNNADPTCRGQVPCHETIQAAVDAARPGDTVRIQAGAYQEQVSIQGKNNVVTADEPDRIVIEADPATPPGSVILQGAVTQCTDGHAVRFQQSRFVTLRGLTITGAGGPAIALQPGRHQNRAIHIERNRLVGNGSPECDGGITVGPGNADTLIANNLIHANGRNGLTFHGAGGGPHFLVGNTIHANEWNGVRVGPNHTLFLVNNVITGNGSAPDAGGGRVGVAQEGGTNREAERVHLLHNLVCGNRLGEVTGPVFDATDANNLTPTGTEGSGVLASADCDLPATVYANLPGPDGLPNTADDDFTLAPASPAIGHGLDPRTLGLDLQFNPLFEGDFTGDDRRPRDRDTIGTGEFDIGALEFVPASSLPPDPATIAPPLDRTVATGLGAATDFLYMGSNPIQSGVAPGTIEARRAAVLRGRVLARDGSPLGGVTITILQHPEYGSTLSRADGAFDLAVNGGSQLTVLYEKAGFLPAQRSVTAPWQDYAWLPDVVLIPYDARVTPIDLTSTTPIQVARGTPAADADGSRQATVLFPQGTTTTMVLPDGTTQALTSLGVRATEYTVGPTGPQAMPGPLPPTSAYTYAVALTVDEAVAAGAKTLRFSQPVINYTENFLNFPVGGIVPVGFYDREKAAWVPSDNGRVVKILGVSGGLAQLDVTGSGVAADATTLAALGITDAERGQLAALYPVGQSLWRAPIPHFTDWDANWGWGPPTDATLPGQRLAKVQQPLDRPTCRAGSIIECQNQILGEAVHVVGTAFRLHYQSDRVPGRKTANTLEIPVSGPSVPASLRRIELEIQVAGQRTTATLAPTPNHTYIFTWDGQDAYGRALYGAHPVLIRIGYVYTGVYQQPAQLQKAFGYNGSGLLVANRTRQEVTLWQEQRTAIGTVSDARAVGLGGWSLDVHHTYDPGGQVLSLGDGRRRSATEIGHIITTVTGSAFWGLTLDGQGNLFFTSGHRVLKKSPAGAVSPVAGTGMAGFSGDGGPALQARLNSPYGLAVDGQGALFIADYQNHRIRKVSPDGIITTVAGNGSCCGSGGGGGNFSGDGGPAVNAGLELPWGVTVDSQGNLFISDTGNSRIRKVSPDGIITTVAGSGTFAFGFSGDGGPATSAKLSWPAKVAVDVQGNMFIPDYNNNRIRKVSPEGVITTVAGTGPGMTTGANFGGGGFTGDGGRATAAQLNGPLAVAVDAQGDLYIPDYFNHRIRRISSDGIITTVVGTGTAGFSGDGGPALAAQLNFPRAVAMDAQGTLHIADGNNGRIRKLTSALPAFADQDLTIPSEDGSELYALTAAGRHLRTLHALTGAVRYQFAYDSTGRLSAVTDGDGNVTTIERDGTGAATEIVAPFGQRTTLTVDANGYLASVTDPAGHTSGFTYTSGGLLTTLTTPRGHVYQFAYDVLGRLTQDSDPAGGSQTLTRTGSGPSVTTTLTTALNRTSTYLVEDVPTAGTRRGDTASDGTQTILQTGSDGRTTTTAPHGTVTTLTQGPDPRFGMQAPLPASLTITTPSGLTSTVTTTRTASLSDPNNLLSLTSLTDTVRLNGRPTTSTYTAASRTWTTTSPAGRQTTTRLDAQGRPLQTQVTGLAPLTLTYDARGRLSTLSQGSGPTTRMSTLTYNSQGFVDSLSDPLSRTVQFTYDAAGRPSTQTLPDGRVIQYTYDANGNVTAITPPSRPTHAFTYTPLDLEGSYDPPDVDTAPDTTTYAYNLDRQLTTVTRPDGTTVTLDYDPGGRLGTLTLPRGPLTYTYAPATGQLSSITAPDGGTLSYTYDGALLTSSTWSGTAAGSVSRTYDSDFRLATESVNGSTPIAFAYDPDGLLTQVGALTLTRDPQHGLLTGSSLGSVTDSRTYSAFGELTQYQATGSGTPLYTAAYTRDPLGRLTEKTETVGGVTTTTAYAYDPAGRLTDVTVDATLVAHYTYDGNGNRLSVTRPSGTVSGTTDAQDRLLTYGAFTYTYTANGELQTATEGGQTTTYAYDPLGNLVGVTLPDGTQIEYVMDGQNRRVGKKVNGVLTQAFLYRNQLNPAAELDEAGNVIARFIYASRPHVPDYMVKGGVTYRVVADHLGSPRLIVDTATGAIAQRLDYDEFGQILQDTNPGFQPFGFAGGLYDPDTQLLRFGARDYDPFTGRWTTKDPTLFASGDPNLYGYVLNDPVNWYDPYGLFRFRTFAKGVVGIVGGLATTFGGVYLTATGVGAAVGIPAIILGELTFAIGLANTVAAFGDEGLPSSPVTLVTGSEKAGDIVDFSAALVTGRALLCVPNRAVRTLSQASTAITTLEATRSIGESASEIDQALRMHRRPSEPRLVLPLEDLPLLAP